MPKKNVHTETSCSSSQLDCCEQQGAGRRTPHVRSDFPNRQSAGYVEDAVGNEEYDEAYVKLVTFQFQVGG